MKGGGDMAATKKFPYKTAVVACSGCGTEQGEDFCTWGCTHCGSCQQACPFGAITWNERGAAEIREELCRGCGLCVKACPKGLIHLHTCADYIIVKCSNHDAGITARQACDHSCIACGVCERTCTAEAICVTEHCAVIDETYCLNCGMCVVKCPRGVLHDRRGIVLHRV